MIKTLKQKRNVKTLSQTQIKKFKGKLNIERILNIERS